MGYPVNTTWDKKRYFGTGVYISAITNQHIYIVMGYNPASYTGGTINAQHIGFYIEDNKVYGTVANGSAGSTLLLETLTGAAERKYEAILTPGVECRFYVNGVDRGAITTNLPSGTIKAFYWLFASIVNYAAEDKQLELRTIRLLQEE